MIGQAFFQSIEQSGLSTWLRESDALYAFPGVLILHTLGMAMLVGVGVAVSLRLLGVARAVPLAAMKSFMPYAWIGFAVNAFSGVLLVIAYPAKALTNPIFYVKLVLVGVSVTLLAKISRNWLTYSREHGLADARGTSAPPTSGDAARAAHDERRARTIAIAALVLWMLTITAGRLLPYTYRYLMADEKTLF